MAIPPRPKPRTEWVALERLTLDAAFQLRDLPGGQLFDEATVTEYLARRENGEDFPPMGAVEEIKGKRQPKLYLFAGFNRAEMYRRAGVNGVEVLVYPGTRQDAEFYALSENSRESALPRTEKDKRKAFDRLVNTPHLLQRVLDAAKGTGGIQRTVAQACGISHGTVGIWLKERGLHATRDGRLEAIAEPDLLAQLGETADPPAAPEKPDEDRDDGDEPEADRPAVEIEDVRRMAAADALSTAQRDIRSLCRQAETLLKGPWADHLRNAARLHQLPFDVREKERRADINDFALVKVEYWPVLVRLDEVFGSLAAAMYSGSDEGAA